MGIITKVLQSRQMQKEKGETVTTKRNKSPAALKV